MKKMKDSYSGVGDDALAYFGDIIKTTRAREGMSQMEFAVKVGVTRTYISMIERGTAQNISYKIVHRICTALGIDVAVALSAGPAVTHPGFGDLPKTLQEFSMSNIDVPWGDIEMLNSIKYRGEQPTTVTGWKIVYSVIRSTIATDNNYVRMTGNLKENQ